MKLHFQHYPEHLAMSELAALTPLLIIPGLFGSAANWRSFGRQFSDTRPVIIVDQRNHGHSPHTSSHSYDDMVQDLQAFCDDHALKKIVLCGHSMGGKVAMLYTLKYPARIQKLLVLDIAPVTYIDSHTAFVEELMKLDLSKLRSRSEADKALQTAIPDTATRLFLLQSLSGSPGEYRWRLNLQVLHQCMDQISNFPRTSEQALNQTLFIAGELSEYLLPEQRAKILQLFPNARFDSIPEAGHWLHVEQPKRLLKTVQEFVRL